MAGKKNTDGSESANSSAQDFFSQAVAEADQQEADLNEGGEEAPEGGKAEYGPGHPYYKADTGGDENEGGDAGDKGEKPNKENPDRFEYWQSQATKQQQKIEQMERQLNQFMSGNNQQQPPAEKQKTPAELIQEKQTAISQLSVPERPEKPDAYNPQDAYTDPDSASFKYRAAMDDWNENFADVTQKRSNLQSEIYDLKIAQLEKPMNKMAANQQVSERNKKTVDYLKENHQFDDEQAMDFISEMSKPESMDMENLVAFYRHKKGLTSQQSRTNDSTNRDNRSPQPRREAAPVIPLGSGAGSHSETVDDEEELGQSFGEALLNFNR